MIIVELCIVTFVCTGIALMTMMVRDRKKKPVPCCPSHFCQEPARIWCNPEDDTAITMCKPCWEKHLYKLEQLQRGHS